MLWIIAPWETYAHDCVFLLANVCSMTFFMLAVTFCVKFFMGPIVPWRAFAFPTAFWPAVAWVIAWVLVLARVDALFYSVDILFWVFLVVCFTSHTGLVLLRHVDKWKRKRRALAASQQVLVGAQPLKKPKRRSRRGACVMKVFTILGILFPVFAIISVTW